MNAAVTPEEKRALLAATSRLSIKHSELRNLVRQAPEIDLEDMSAYLATLRTRMVASSHPQCEIVRDYLDKMIDGIDDHLQEERAEVEQ